MDASGLLYCIGGPQAAIIVQQAATPPSYVRCADYAVAFYDAAKAA